MNGRALYNEIDEFAADWLENLIRADLIAPGRVERRSIIDLSGQHRQQPQNSCTGVVGDTDDTGSQGQVERRNRRDERSAGAAGLAFFSDADWILCTDGQARPVEVGTFPLAHGEPARVGKLRAYGNQIFRPLAAQFILAADEAIRSLP